MTKEKFIDEFADKQNLVFYIYMGDVSHDILGFKDTKEFIDQFLWSEIAASLGIDEDYARATMFDIEEYIATYENFTYNEVLKLFDAQ